MARVIFETPRLLGRQLEPCDLDDMLTVYGDAGAMRWVGDGEPITVDEAVEWLDKTVHNYQSCGYGMNALVMRESGDVIGFCGLVHPGGQREAEIKYALKRAYWGQGLATEAARALLAYGKRQHGLDYVIATTAPENTASHRVLLKAGMAWGKLEQGEDGIPTQFFEWHGS